VSSVTQGGGPDIRGTLARQTLAFISVNYHEDAPMSTITTKDGTQIIKRGRGTP